MSPPTTCFRQHPDLARGGGSPTAAVAPLAEAIGSEERAHRERADEALHNAQRSDRDDVRDAYLAFAKIWTWLAEAASHKPGGLEAPPESVADPARQSVREAFPPL